MESAPDTDVLLMHRLVAGDDLAMNELMVRWRDRVAAFILRMVGDHATAMDLTQETFVRLYMNRHRYKPVAAFSTYLFHIAANLARSQARWRKRHPMVPLEDDQGNTVHEVLDARPAPDEAATVKEKAALVSRAIDALPHEWREALLLYAVEQMSQNDIARTLGCSPKAVEVRIYKARQALREVLANEAR